MNRNIEPHADSRCVAREMRQQFIALAHEGFSEEQALQIVIAQMTTAMTNAWNGNSQ